MYICIVIDYRNNMKEDNNENGMKILTLIIKQRYFDAILQGRKVQEFREIRPTNEKKYVQFDEQGQLILDENDCCVPVKYDAIRFFVGYQKDRDTALVEVKSAFTQVLVDDKGNPINYDFNGLDYWAEQVVYNLGRVLEHNIREKSRIV